MSHPAHTSFAKSPLVSLAVLALILASVFAATPANAHSGKQSYLYVSVFGTEVEGRVEMPIADLARVLEIAIPAETEPAQAALLEHRAVIQDYLAEHFALGTGGVEWDLVYDDVGILPTEEGAYALFPFVVADTLDTEPREFTVRFDVIYETDPNRDNLVIIENDWQSATFANEAIEIIGLSTGMTERRVELQNVSSLSSLSEIRRLGSNTFRFQTELVFTLIALVMLIGLLSVAAQNRREAPSITEVLGRGRTSLLAFLACQAIGLWIVSAGSIELGVRLTSTIAAAGLLAAAASALFVWWRPVLGRFLPPVVAALGATNGIVVGGGATRLDLHRSRFILSLLAFHVGLVLVTVVVVAIVGVAMAQLRHSRFAPTIAVAVALSFVALSTVWMFEQVAGDAVQINLIDPQPERLRSQLAVLVVLLMTAVAVRTYDRRAGRQRPVHQPS